MSRETIKSTLDLDLDLGVRLDPAKTSVFPSFYQIVDSIIKL